MGAEYRTVEKMELAGLGRRLTLFSSCVTDSVTGGKNFVSYQNRCSLSMLIIISVCFKNITFCFSTSFDRRIGILKMHTLKR